MKRENKQLQELDNLEDYFYVRRKPAADDFTPRKKELIEIAEKVKRLPFNIKFQPLRKSLKIFKSLIAMSYMIQLS